MANIKEEGISYTKKAYTEKEIISNTSYESASIPFMQIIFIIFIIGCIFTIINNGQDFHVKEYLINLTTKSNKIIPIQNIFDFSNMNKYIEIVENAKNPFEGLTNTFAIIGTSIYDIVRGIIRILTNLTTSISMILGN